MLSPVWCSPPDPPSPTELRPLLKRMGLPPLVGFRPLGRQGTVWDWGLDFAEDIGQVVLRIEAPPGEGLARELAAMQLLAMLEVPVTRQYQSLPRGTLSSSAALCLWPAAESGVWMARSAPDDVFKALGLSVSILGNSRLPWHGTRADGGRFLPLRPSWRGEVLARLASTYGRLQAAGIDLGPVTSQALARVEAGLPYLEAVDSFALVHGDLCPSVIYLGRVGEDLIIHGITCWQAARLADPLMEWPPLLTLPLRELAWVLEGYGEADLLLTEQAQERLELYALLAQLERLALASWEPDPSRIQCQVAATLPALLERGWVERRILAALEGEEGPALRPPVPQHLVLRRRALECLRRPLDLADTQRVEAALALALLAQEDAAAESALVTRGLTLLDGVSRGWPQAAEPVGADWLEELLRLPNWGPDGGAEALAWLGLDALTRVGPVSDAVRRGLQVQVQARRTGASSVPRQGRLRAQVGLRGLAAGQGLERVGGLRAAPRMLERFAQHLRLSTRGLVAQLGPRPSLSVRAARWAARDDAVVMAEAPLVVAARALGDDCPVPLDMLGY